jgi:hypothetical protein
MTETGVVAGRALTDFVSLGVLASWVPRDAVDDAVEATGKGAAGGGKLPPQVVVYLVMALALFASEDYEEVVALLTQALRAWGCWDEAWEPPTKGAVTQARHRLGPSRWRSCSRRSRCLSRRWTPKRRSSARGG